MIIVTVARKPLAATSVAANVLEHGTGALNIDAARIAPVSGDAYAGLTVGTGDPGALNPGCGPSFPHHKENWGAWKAKAEGRWPANLIFEHKLECQQMGTKQVKGTSPTPSGFDRYNARLAEAGYRPDAYTKGPPPPPPSRTDERGNETVAAWACAIGCPVAALDQQSGVSVSNVRQGGEGEPLDPSQEGWRFLRAPGGFKDEGGASRFFKQIKR